MPRVNQSDPVKRLASEFEIPVARAKKMVDFFIGQISEELIKGNVVSLRNFGKGGIAHYKPRVRLAISTRLRRRL